MSLFKEPLTATFDDELPTEQPRLSWLSRVPRLDIVVPATFVGLIALFIVIAGLTTDTTAQGTLPTFTPTALTTLPTTLPTFTPTFTAAQLSDAIVAWYAPQGDAHEVPVASGTTYTSTGRLGGDEWLQAHFEGYGVLWARTGDIPGVSLVGLINLGSPTPAPATQTPYIIVEERIVERIVPVAAPTTAPTATASGITILACCDGCNPGEGYYDCGFYPENRIPHGAFVYDGTREMLVR